MGIGKDGQPKDSFTPGVEVVGKQTIFSEGCRGSCTKKLMSKFDLNKDAQEQTYALGVKVCEGLALMDKHDPLTPTQRARAGRTTRGRQPCERASAGSAVGQGFDLSKAGAFAPHYIPSLPAAPPPPHMQSGSLWWWLCNNFSLPKVPPALSSPRGRPPPPLSKLNASKCRAPLMSNAWCSSPVCVTFPT